MHSSPQELMLLLRKWSSESIKVCAVASTSPKEGFAALAKVFGRLSLDEPGATFAVEGEDGCVLMCHLAYMGFGYSLAADINPDDLNAIGLDPDEVEDLAMLRNADLGSSILLFSLKE